MGTRAKDLTEIASEVAERLNRRMGSFKVLLSAGVIALDALTAEDRETAVAIANGEKLTLDLYAKRLSPGEQLLADAEELRRRKEQGSHRRSQETRKTPQKRRA